MKLTDITIYTFLWPILAADSVDKSRAVWCSKDRAKAWDDIMSHGIVPKGDSNCATPFDRNVELARRFGAQGTPAIYLSDGNNVGGFLAADKLEAALRSVSAR
jgi:thiol:disulfide interchange protein DsbC